jgi:hypothetical protein
MRAIPHRSLGQEPDELLRDRKPVCPNLDVLKLMEIYDCTRDGTLANSQMGFLQPEDGSFWLVTIPQAIRALQTQSIEMFAEQHCHLPTIRLRFGH